MIFFDINIVFIFDLKYSYFRKCRLAIADFGIYELYIFTRVL